MQGQQKCCHLLEKKATHPIRMQDFQTQTNTTCNRTNNNAGFPDTTKLHAEENATTFWRRPLSWWECGISRHNKNHSLPKRDTMLTSITCCVTDPNDIQILHQFVSKTPERKKSQQVLGQEVTCPRLWWCLGVGVLWVRKDFSRMPTTHLCFVMNKSEHVGGRPKAGTVALYSRTHPMWTE